MSSAICQVAERVLATPLGKLIRRDRPHELNLRGDRSDQVNFQGDQQLLRTDHYRPHTSELSKTSSRTRLFRVTHVDTFTTFGSRTENSV